MSNKDIDENGFNTEGVSDPNIRAMRDLLTKMINKDIQDIVKSAMIPIGEEYDKQIQQLNKKIESLNQTINTLSSEKNLFIKEDVSQYVVNDKDYDIVYDFSDWIIIPNIKNVLEQRGLKQTWLQEKTQIPQSTLRSILNNEKTISLENAFRISMALGVSINQLFNYVSISDIVLEEE